MAGTARALDLSMSIFHPPPMPPKPRQLPVLSAHGKAEALRRQAREAAALRDNLRKRKQQGRAREDTPPAAGDPSSEERGEA
jgi:hypothetical protein